MTSSGVDNSKDDETQTEAAADNSVQQTVSGYNFDIFLVAIYLC